MSRFRSYGGRVIRTRYVGGRSVDPLAQLIIIGFVLVLFGAYYFFFVWKTTDHVGYAYEKSWRREIAVMADVTYSESGCEDDIPWDAYNIQISSIACDSDDAKAGNRATWFVDEYEEVDTLVTFGSDAQVPFWYEDPGSALRFGEDLGEYREFYYTKFHPEDVKDPPSYKHTTSDQSLWQSICYRPCTYNLSVNLLKQVRNLELLPP